jgi:hypothetical protein
MLCCCHQSRLLLLLLLLTRCMLAIMRLARASALLAHSHSASMGSSMRPLGSLPCMFATCSGGSSSSSMQGCCVGEVGD